MLGVAALGAAGCSPNADEPEKPATGNTSEIAWDKETDVVVVGFGGAGCAAAIEAADNGASVILLDKEAVPGGASSINGNVIQAAGTSVQKAAGIEDDADRWFECLKIAIGDGFKESHMKALTQQSAQDIDWLIDLGAVIPPEIHPTDNRSIPESGLYFSDASLELFPSDSETPRGHTLEGGFLPPLQNGIDAREGIESMVETPVNELVTDVEGHVIGVVAESGGKPMYVKANKGVIIATGHFSLNESMISRYMPWVLTTAGSASAHPSATGDGHIMCQKVGAELINMGSGTFYQVGVSGFDTMTEMCAMTVNKHCQRYWSEQGWHNNYRGTYLIEQPDHLGFIIVSENIRAQFGDLEPDAFNYKGETIEELANACGLHPQALAAAVAKYNQYCEDGVDPEFGKPAKFLVPLSEGPYYAGQASLSWMTSGGMSIDDAGRVLNAEEQPIAGLYAAGMCAAAYGKLNPGSGLNMAWCIYTGRLAGKSAATA